MSVTVCYCHNYSKSDIEKDVRRNDGRSLILEKILAEKKLGACRCETKHSEHR